MERKLIESWLPINEINEAALAEGTFIRIPKINNLHPWFARRICGVGRVLNLGAVLPDNSASRDALWEFSGLKRRKTTIPLGALYMFQPPIEEIALFLEQELGKRPEEITIVDSMAGGAAIPLESLRCGFKTIAMDYNPISYLILKVTVEFPAKYADQGLFEKTLTEAREMVKWARENLGEIYGSDAENYIFAKGTRCPYCDGLIPLIGFDKAITNRNWSGNYLEINFDPNSKDFSARCVNSPSRKWLKKVRKGGSISFECPYCGKFFTVRGREEDHAFAIWFKKHAQAMEGIVEGFVPAEEVMDTLLELHIPLIKQVGSGFKAIRDDREEREKFAEAIKKLAEEAQTGELIEYIPIDPIPSSNYWASSARSFRLTKWYMLYNPRQLYALSKLAQYIAKRAEKLVKEEGELGAAIALYLAFAFDKVVDYNTIATKWQGSKFKTGIADTLRGESTLDFRYEYCEIKKVDEALMWALEPDVAESEKADWWKRTGGGVLPVLRILCEWFKGKGLGDRTDVFLADATKLSSIIGEDTINIINVDPPYFEQEVYSDKIEFIWAFLKRALKPALDILFPKEKVKIPWNPMEGELPRSRELVVRGKSRSELKDGDTQVSNFKSLFEELCLDFAKSLKGNGILILWFTHPGEVAWKCVGEALYKAGFKVSKVYPMVSEMPTRYKAMVNKVAQHISLAIIARKGERERLVGISEDVRASLANNMLFTAFADELAKESLQMSKGTRLETVDAFALTLGTGISIATNFELPFKGAFQDLYSSAITQVITGFVGNVIKEILRGGGAIQLDEEAAKILEEKVWNSMLYEPFARAFVPLILASRIDISRGRLYSHIKPETPVLGLDFDFSQTVSKLCGSDLGRLISIGLIREERVDGKAYMPAALEALAATTGRVSLKTFLSTLPGRATFAVYTSLKEIGTPEVKAKAIGSKIKDEIGRPLSGSELIDIGSFGLLLMGLLNDEEIIKASGRIPSSLSVLDANILRSGAIEALKRLLG